MREGAKFILLGRKVAAIILSSSLSTSPFLSCQIDPYQEEHLKTLEEVDHSVDGIERKIVRLDEELDGIEKARGAPAIYALTNPHSLRVFCSSRWLRRHVSSYIRSASAALSS